MIPSGCWQIQDGSPSTGGHKIGIRTRLPQPPGHISHDDMLKTCNQYQELVH